MMIHDSGVISSRVPVSDVAEYPTICISDPVSSMSETDEFAYNIRGNYIIL